MQTNHKKIIQSIISTIIPYKSKTYYVDYSQTIKEIIVERNRLKIWLKKVQIYCCFYIIIITLIRSRLDSSDRFYSYIFVDMIIFIFQQQDNHLHYIFILLVYMAIYLIQTSFLKIGSRFLPTLKLFTVEPNEDERFHNQFTKPIDQNYHGQDVLLYHRKISYWLLCILQIFVIIGNIVSIYYHWKFMLQTFEHCDRLFDFSLFGLGLYIFHWFNLLCLDVALYSFIDISVLATSTGLSYLHYLKIRINQNIKKLNELRSGQWPTIRNFISNDLISFKMLFLLNRIYGRMLAVFILVNMPCNAYLMTRFIFKFESFSKIALIVGITVLLEQFEVIGLIHLLVAKLSNRLHRPPIRLFHFMANKRNHIRQTSNRIRVDLTIARLHTNNRYGVTYGRLSLITMQTFAKVSKITKKNLKFYLLMFF